ncbi:hypothetical protein [uncultured Microbacterium sp.]|uniref:hypothetical protein n=1 Tax=uncultured Microbacterium sp. TaxID=191216 RepID=UPI0028DBB700|nr:hypothetical protein [uncultured Microbacterium sp.]
MTLSDNIVGFIRTSVPLGVGALVSWLVTLGIVLPVGTELQLASALTAVVAAAYWALVTWASKRWQGIGWLLGNPKQPMYIAHTVVAPAPLPGETRDDYRERTGLDG